MLGMGPTELIVIIFLALLIFGPKRMPEIMQYVGKAIRQVREFSGGVQDAVSKDIMQPINEELITPITDVKDSIKDSIVKETVNPIDNDDDTNSSLQQKSCETEGVRHPR